MNSCTFESRTSRSVPVPAKKSIYSDKICHKFLALTLNSVFAIKLSPFDPRYLTSLSGWPSRPETASSWNFARIGRLWQGKWNTFALQIFLFALFSFLWAVTISSPKIKFLTSTPQSPLNYVRESVRVIVQLYFHDISSARIKSNHKSRGN